jgi:hypothetical protein
MRRGLKPLRESVIKKLKEYNKLNQKRLQESYAKKIKKQRLQERLSKLLRPLIEESIKQIIKKK